jgi:uncharacterized membrane protein SpoIIM required for sporulation
MVEKEAMSLLGGGFVLSLLLGVIIAGTFGVAWPLMMFSMMRNTKKIRVELQRLNEILETRLSLDVVTPPRR